MAISIVQRTSGYIATGGSVSMAAPVTAGNILIAQLGVRSGSASLNPKLTNSIGPDRPFTYFGADVEAVNYNTDHANIGYRIATGDEQTLYFGVINDVHVVYTELSGTDATACAAAQVLRSDQHAASATKSVGSLSSSGTGHAAFYTTINRTDFDATLTESAGTGWTERYERGTGGGADLHPHIWHGDATGMSGAITASESGSNIEWGGIAVDIGPAAVSLGTCGFSPMLFDVYSDNGDGTLTYIDTLCDAFDKKMRVELDGTGSGEFTINRDSAEAIAATLGNGADISRLVKVRIPGVSGSVAIFAFWIENGDFGLLSSQEAGDENLHFSGRGGLAYLDRGIMADHSFLTDPFIGDDPFTNEWRGFAAGSGAAPGQILWRVVRELQEASRVIGATASHPVPALVMDFAPAPGNFPLLDSDGNAWATTAATADFTEQVGERVLSVVGRLIGTGSLTVQCSPDLVLSGYNSFGNDRTGGSFGAGVVRFVDAVNIRDSLQRQVRGGRPGTHELVAGNGTDVYGHAHLNDTTKPHWEMFNTSQSADVTTLDGVGLSDLTQRLLRSESLQVPVLCGDDQANGLYLPGPAATNGHYWVGDTLTVTTGAGDFDLADVDLRVAAITIAEPNSAKAVTDLQVITELNSTLIVNTPTTSGDFGGGGIVGSSGGGGGGGGSSGDPTAERNTRGGQSRIKAHGNTGSTETFDPVDGNVHTATLNANCTFSLTAPVGSGACTLELWITGSGTRTWTWPGSVTWDGGVTGSPPADTLTVRVILETVDGGTNWIANMVGNAFTNPMTTRGDIIIENSTPAPSRLAIGASGRFLSSNGTDPSWGQGPLTTTGDLMLGATAGTPTRLAIGANAYVLTSNGTTASWAASSASAAAISALGFVGPIVMTDGITSPPEPVWSEDGTDYLYSDL